MKSKQVLPLQVQSGLASNGNNEILKIPLNSRTGASIAGAIYYHT